VSQWRFDVSVDEVFLEVESFTEGEIRGNRAGTDSEDGDSTDTQCSELYTVGDKELRKLSGECLVFNTSVQMKGKDENRLELGSG